MTVIAMAAAGVAQAAPQPSAPTAVGALKQLRGASGCLVDRAQPPRGCTPVRALDGAAPFLGSNAIAISGDGRNVYVAASRADAIAVFHRSARSGRLTQSTGVAGCVAARGAGGCATARALDGPNSVAVSPDGRNVYATSLATSTITVFRRDRSTGALTQLRGGAGCLADAALPGCVTGRALKGPDIVTVSPDGTSVYVGAFLDSAIAVLARDPSTGALTQPADATGCVVDAPRDGCTTGLALGSPEGMAISGDGATVYVAAATGNAIGIFVRDPSTGALSQSADGTGCIVATPLAGCSTGTQLRGANAVAISADDATVYVTSLLSNSLTTFTRTAATGQLAQQSGTSACVIFILAVGCSLGRALDAPEGVAVAPDGASVYAAAFLSGALDVFDRDTGSGAVIQKSRRRGCMTTPAIPGCTAGRALSRVSSVAVSPDGRHVYAAAFRSDAVAAFARVTGSTAQGEG